MDRKTRRQLVERLNRDATLIAARFSLCYRAVEADRANATSRYGICYSDGTIRIRLRHATTGRPLKYSSLVNTLCHELAHLRHFNHGPRFKDFYLRILAYAREAEIYQPSRPRRAAAPPALAPRAQPAPAQPAPPQRTATTPQATPGGGAVQLDLFA
jgi:predicted metal-dependent hydrolase